MGMVKILVVGPSGCGKTLLTTKLKETKLARSFDLDVVGYRVDHDDWKEWNIPTSIFRVLSEVAIATKQNMVAAGCDSHPDQLVKAAVREGFTPIVVLPTVAQLTRYRQVRGDDDEKVADSESSLESWLQHAQRLGLKTVRNVADIMSLL